MSINFKILFLSLVCLLLCHNNTYAIILTKNNTSDVLNAPKVSKITFLNFKNKKQDFLRKIQNNNTTDNPYLKLALISLGIALISFLLIFSGYSTGLFGIGIFKTIFFLIGLNFSILTLIFLGKAVNFADNQRRMEKLIIRPK